MEDGYRQRIANHFREGNATEEDWLLLGQVFLIVTILATHKEGLSITTQMAISDLPHLIEFNQRVNFDKGVMSGEKIK